MRTPKGVWIYYFIVFMLFIFFDDYVDSILKWILYLIGASILGFALFVAYSIFLFTDEEKLKRSYYKDEIKRLKEGIASNRCKKNGWEIDYYENQLKEFKKKNKNKWWVPSRY